MSTASVAATSGAPAGFLLRLVASIIDGVILSIVVFLLSMVLGFVFGMNGIMMATIVLMLLGLLPLIAGNLAMMLVFFRAARELQSPA